MTHKEIPVSAWRSKLKTVLKGETQINIRLQTTKKIPVCGSHECLPGGKKPGGGTFYFFKLVSK